MVVEIISIILSVILSSMSIYIAVKAYKQGTRQIEISNKQSLFKERIRVFTLLNELYEGYELNRHLLKEAVEMPDFIFNLLTGNKFLKDTIELMEKPLSNKEQNYFLSKTEELRAISLEITFLWENMEATYASLFVLDYVDFLCVLYKQQVYLKTLESREKFKLTEFKSSMDSMANKTGLYKTMKSIDSLYNEIKEKKVLEKLKEQIKLK